MKECDFILLPAIANQYANKEHYIGFSAYCVTHHQQISAPLKIKNKSLVFEDDETLIKKCKLMRFE